MSKEIAVSLWEHTKEEAGKHSLARDKHAVPQLKYFTFEEVKSEH